MNNQNKNSVSVNSGEKESESSRFQGQVLSRVYRVWLVRRFLPVFVLEVIVFSAVLYILARAVFVQVILESAMKVFFENPTGIVKFTAVTFGNSSFENKILGIAVVILLALLLRSLTQGILRLILVKRNYFRKI